MGRAPRTRETLPDFRESGQVTRHSRVFRKLTGSQWTLGFWRVTISFELIYDYKIQNSMNENMMNFQYIKHTDVEHLNGSLELKETILSLNENSAKKSSSDEEKVHEVEKSSEGLILKELPKHLKYAFLGAERVQPVIIVTDLTVEKEHKLIKILRKYKEAIA